MVFVYGWCWVWVFAVCVVTLGRLNCGCARLVCGVYFGVFCLVEFCV